MIIVDRGKLYGYDLSPSPHYFTIPGEWFFGGAVPSSEPFSLTGDFFIPKIDQLPEWLTGRH
jgi:hypothetical protein